MFSGQYAFANAGPQFNNQGAQQGGQQPNQQQMMFNQQQQPQQQPQQQQQQPQQQQFAGMPQGAFPPGANPQMMHAQQGMMQNPAMANMAQNGQMGGYPQQFAAAYAQGMQQQPGFNPNNYMMAAGMQGFPMNQQGMTPQQAQMMQQRLQQQQMQMQMQQQQQQQQHAQHQQQQQQQQQPQQQPHQQPQHPQHMQQQQHHPQHQGSAPIGQNATPQRPPSVTQGTPNPMQGQPQFSPPQPSPQSQTPSGQPQPPGNVATPQTPNFPNQGPTSVPSMAQPLSPGSETRDKERFALLLDINHELLYESILIQSTQQELKKEKAAATNGAGPDKKMPDEDGLFQQDYLQCMRRLQANLSYMAALADRKPEVKAPPCPAYLSAPPLNLSLKPRAQPMTADGSASQVDATADREERDKAIKDLYRRLQAVFPGFDPKKEPAFRAPAGKPGNPGGAHGSPIAQQTPQMPNTPMPPGVPVGMAPQ